MMVTYAEVCNEVLLFFIMRLNQYEDWKNIAAMKGREPSFANEVCHVSFPKLEILRETFHAARWYTLVNTTCINSQL